MSLPVRLSLGALRMLVLLGVLGMLLEPVLVFSKTEYVPSNLLVLLDQSASMDLRDAYVDQQRAAQIAESLKLPGGPEELRQRPRLELARRLLSSFLDQVLAPEGDAAVEADRDPAAQAFRQARLELVEPPYVQTPGGACSHQVSNRLAVR